MHCKIVQTLCQPFVINRLAAEQVPEGMTRHAICKKFRHKCSVMKRLNGLSRYLPNGPQESNPNFS